MKKVLLFAIIALCMNAFAQNKMPESKPVVNSMGRFENTGTRKCSVHSGMNLKQDLKQQQPGSGSLIQIFDSLYEWQWDTIQIAWRLSDKYIDMIYDANHNLKSCRVLGWAAGAWTNSMTYKFTYDAGNNQTIMLCQLWNGSTWVDSWQYKDTYDANNNMTSELYQTWNGISWVNSWQYFFTYDPNNNQTSELFQSWNGSIWVDIWLYQYIYDGSNNLITELYQVIGSDSTLEYYSRTFNTYDAGNNLINELFQSWNDYDSIWVNSYQHINTFNTNKKLVQELSQDWDGSNWIDGWKSTYTYDVNNNLMNELTQYWDGSIWVNSSRSAYTYDIHNNPSGELYQNWTGSTWVNRTQYLYLYDADNFMKISSYKNWFEDGTEIRYGDSLYYYYHTVLGINDFMTYDRSLIVYPNPGNGMLTISGSFVINSVEIYNSLGNLICSDVKLNGHSSNEIDLSGYSKGLYVMKINSGSRTYTRKIFIQ
jgi:hypothetical protein